ncbi:ceramidase domain-containing protein [soil metagenome]
MQISNGQRERQVLFLLAFFLITIAAVLLLPPVAQTLGYHNFADSRTVCGVNNFGNVASNGAILLGGLSGLFLLFFSAKRHHAFASRDEWWPYFFVFLGATLIAVGSAYYHYQPNNQTLIWDRLPMAIMFMAMFGAVVAERISLAAAKILTAPLVVLGVASVVGWALSEGRGSGDLRFYAVVQFFPMLATPLILWLFPARYSGQSYLVGSIAWYALAKVFEMLDWQVFVATSGSVSGHTIKHMLCGLSIYWLVLMLKRRQLVVA